MLCLCLPVLLLPLPVPRQLLAANPPQQQHQHAPPQLSTDGRYLAYIKPAPDTGVSNVFVRKLPAPQSTRPSPNTEGADTPTNQQQLSIFERDGTDGDRQVTFDSVQGVDAYSWAEDGASIFFIQDNNGDENYHLFFARVSSPGAAVDLTPFPGVKAQGIVSSEIFPNKLFIVSSALCCWSV